VAIVVRPADASEVADVAELAARTFALACPPTATPADIEATIGSQLSSAAFTGYIADPERRVAVAEDAGHLVGYTMINFGPADPDVVRQLTAAGAAAELSKIYVDPAHHGGGVARALFEDALAAVRDAGRPAVWLGTNVANLRAQRFYEKVGFIRVGTKRFRLGDSWEDDYVFERALT
jgi:diamine N-acetyltransferase